MRTIQQKLLLIITLTVTGCSNNGLEPDQSSSITKLTEISEKCATDPPPELILRDPQEVTLKSSLKKIGEGQISSTETVGYKFKGKSGQTLHFNLASGEVCLWLINPSNQVFQGNKLPETGTYLVQLAAPKGKKMNYILSMGLDVTSPSPSPSPTSTSSTSPTPSPSPSATNKLSQEDAVATIKGWYDAKQDVFGSGYQTSVARKYLTGKELYKTIEKCNDGFCGGSVGWLRRNNCYYHYYSSDIQQVIDFSSSDTNAQLTVRVREKLQLRGPSSAGCGKSSQTYTKNVRYWLKKDGTQWKISEYKVGV